MTPPLADPVRARASCIVIVAWRVPHPRVSVFREGGSGRPPLCVSMNKANLSVAGAARAGQGRAGLGAGWGPTDFQVTACLTPLFGARHTQTTCKTDHLGPQLLPSRMDDLDGRGTPHAWLPGWDMLLAGRRPRAPPTGP